MNDSKPVVAHIVGSYLFHTGSWIYTQLKNVRTVRPIVLTTKVENLDQFPFEPVYCYQSLFYGTDRWRAKANSLLGAYTGARDRFFRNAIQHENAAMLHAHFGQFGYRSLGLHRKCDIPLLTTFYGTDVSRLPKQKPEWNKRYRRLFEEGDLFLAEGSHMGHCLVDLGCSPDKVKVQHLGVDLNRIAFAERRMEKGRPVRILMATTFREKKGIPFAIEAFSRVAPYFPNAELRILGGVDSSEGRALLEYCQGLAKNGGAGERIHFLGKAKYSQYTSELAQAHLFMAPSVHARDGDTEGGAPVALIEAAAAGIPSIASRHCDIPEVVIDGLTGVLADERDVPGLVRALESLLDAPETWPEFGRRARAHVEKEYHMETQARKLEAIYAAVLENDRSNN